MKQGLLFFLILGSTLLHVWAQEPFSKGSFLLEEQQFQSARIHFLLQLKSRPNDAGLLIGLGNAYVGLQSPDSAKIAFKRAFQVGQSNPNVLAGMGMVALLNNDHDAASDYFERTRRADKTNPEIYCNLAEACLNPFKTDTVSALSYLKQGLDLSPKYGRLHQLTGDLELVKKNFGSALNAYERATFFDPKSAISYRKAGYAYFRSAAFREALNDFNKSIALNPDQILVYKYQGDLFYTLGRYQEAEQAYLTYHERAEVTSEDKERMAFVLFFSKKYEDSAKLLEQLTSVSREESVLLRIKGYIAYETGNYQKGLDDLDQFFQQHNPEKIIALDYSYYAKILQKLGKDSLARLNFIKSAALDSNRMDTYEELARYESKKGMHQQAALHFRKMMDRGADKLITSFQIGKEFYFEGEIWRTRLDSVREVEKSGHTPLPDSTAIRKSMVRYYSRADSTFAMVNQLNPEYAGAYVWRGRIQSILDPDALATGAKEMYEKALSILEKSELAKNQKTIIECYRYLGSYYYLGYERFLRKDKVLATEMKTKSMDCFTKISTLDPADNQAKEVLSKINKRK